MFTRNYTFNFPNALVYPYRIRGELITHATITVVAGSRAEGLDRARQDYVFGVKIGEYKEQAV